MPRPGTPQSRHLHVLLPGGQRALSDLFQNFERDLIAAGSVPVRMFRDCRMEVPGIGTLPQRDFDWFLYCGTRPLIEMATRRQVERLTNVTIRQGCAVFKIAADPDGGMTATFAGSNETIRADLIVDASGRAAPTLSQLRSTGHPLPEEVVVGIDLHYTTTTFAIPQDAPDDWMGVATGPNAPESSRGGYLMPVEGMRWIATFSGQLGFGHPTIRKDSWIMPGSLIPRLSITPSSMSSASADLSAMRSGQHMAPFRSAENISPRPATHRQFNLPLQSCLWSRHERGGTGSRSSEADSEKQGYQARSA